MLQNSKITQAAALLSIAMVAADARKQADAPVDHEYEKLLDMKIFGYEQKQEDSVSGTSMQHHQMGSTSEEIKRKKEKKEKIMQDVAGLKGKGGLKKYTRRYNRKRGAREHPDFAKAMEERGGENGKWMSYGAVTEDGYVLRMFRIIGAYGKRKRARKFKQEKGPLLLIHGFATDSITWMSQSDPSLMSLAQQLFEDGYDVWLANMRGSRRSRRHIAMDPDSAEDDYWEFDMLDMAEYDIPAMIERIRDVRNNTKRDDVDCMKVSIVAHDLGASNIVTALSIATKAQDYIAQVVLMEPCMFANPNLFFGFEYFSELGGTLAYLGIKSLFGPNWEAQRTQLCDESGEIAAFFCDALSRFDLYREEDNWGGWQEYNYRVGLHLTQNAFSDRFQEFSDEFNVYDESTYDANEYDLESISNEIPIRVIFADADDFCPDYRQTDFLNLIPSYNEWAVVSGGHGTSSYSNDAEFFAVLKSLLVDNGVPMADYVCTGDFAW